MSAREVVAVAQSGSGSAEAARLVKLALGAQSEGLCFGGEVGG